MLILEGTFRADMRYVEMGGKQGDMGGTESRIYYIQIWNCHKKLNWREQKKSKLKVKECQRFGLAKKTAYFLIWIPKFDN